MATCGRRIRRTCCTRCWPTTSLAIEAWEYIKRNWETIVGKFPDSALPRMCEAINGLLDRQKEVEEFFHQHKVRLGGKLIDQHLERLSVAVAFRQREGAKLEASLKA